ncbi:putative 1-acylglycerol-3-phosphate acyltransferase [Phyllosticta citrichinensis]|uniref:1-acyl-sn-glycerol-3-phosphate acyltransferase n=1 Tax=Phyllosticta citrichinensis TaxID=1130410 RepID=A0ABR1XI36_9PEZI
MGGLLSTTFLAVILSPLLFHILSAATSPVVPPVSRMLSFAARAIAGFTSLILCAAYGVVASAALRVVGYGGLSQYFVARAFKWCMWLTTGVSFKVVEGEEYLKTRPAVFIGNHQTELDVLMLGCVFPPYCSVSAKKSLKYVPILGWFMALSKSVFIDRGNRTNARAAFDGAANYMRSEQQSVFIFTEGTRSYASRPELLPFKKGAFHLAVQAQVPIVPIVVANYSNVLNIQKRVFSSGVIPVKVLPPVQTVGLTTADVDRLTVETREDMLTTLMGMARSANGAPMAMKADGGAAHEPVKKEL